ncbi:MAG TPA: DUF86 domain-containing protein [Patescibacteria group bacterium]|nr:DUF86 domain-containing protein [Patescibacteria group bacterium]
MNNTTHSSIDKVHIRLKALEEYAGILKNLQGVTGAELKTNIDKRAKAERYLQLAAESCIDIAEFIIADQRLPTPQTYRHAIELLGDHNVINKEFAYNFAKVASFRNILVHDYLQVDYEQIANNINHHLDDFDKFARQIASYLI